jgi:hypothetical protein
MNEEEKKSIKERILEKIKSNQVKMRPKIYFLLKTVFIIAGVIFFLFLTAFLVSFIHFHLRVSGLWYLPSFGLRVFGIYLRSLPWLLILSILFLILILEILSKKFSFVWKRPLIYSLLAIVFIIILGTFIFEKISIHQRLLLEAQTGKMPPPFSPIYQRFGMPRFKDFHRGVIEKITEDGFLLRELSGEQFNVIPSKEIKFLFEKIKEGDSVVVVGKREDSKILAIAIRKIDDRFRIFERRIHGFPGLK